MEITRILFFFLILLCQFRSVFSQDHQSFRVTPNQFFKHYYLLNPAGYTTDEKLRVQAGNRSLTGVLRGVSNNYANLKLNIYTSEKNFHTTGISYTNTQRGEYIQLNRLYLRYAWTTGLTENSSLSAGISGGVVNYSLAASQASSGGSDFGADISAGIWYLRERFKAGASVLQILNPTLQPLNEELVLQRYLNINSSVRFPTDFSSYFEVHGWFSYPFRNKDVHFSVAPLFNWKETLEIGAGYDMGHGFFGYFGVPGVKIGNGKLDLSFSYLIINTRQLSDITDSVVELTLGWTSFK